MDFLEELFEIGKRKYQKSGGVFYDKDHKDDDHDDDDDDDKRRQYPTKSYNQVPTYHPQVTSSPVTLLSSSVCRGCSMQTVQGAKFCHKCGTAMELILPCASCGSKLPVNEPLCSQCGYGN
ncbi:MAG: zinc ribbon domain-containing protein [Chloroflexota bacterium]|nr:zinc ribbon domain-containing protein [Chloroflexota bacterium]